MCNNRDCRVTLRAQCILPGLFGKASHVSSAFDVCAWELRPLGICVCSDAMAVIAGGRFFWSRSLLHPSLHSLSPIPTQPHYTLTPSPPNLTTHSPHPHPPFTLYPHPIPTHPSLSSPHPIPTHPHYTPCHSSLPPTPRLLKGSFLLCFLFRILLFIRFGWVFVLFLLE